MKSILLDKKSYSLAFIRDIIRYFPSKFIPLLISFLWSYIFTRVFPPEAYGVYGLVLAVTGPLITIIVEWAAQPIGRFYNEYKENGMLDIYNSIITKLFNFTIIFTLAATIIGGYIFWKYYNGDTTLLVPAILSVIFNSITNLYMPIIPASLKANTFSVLQVFRNVVRLVIACLLVFTLEKDVAYLIWAETIACLIFLFPLLKIVREDISTSNTVDSMLIKQHLIRFVSYGLPMMLWFFSSQLLNVGDRFVIQHFLGEKEVGIYTANYQLITGISALLNVPIALAAFPLIMKQWINKDEEKVKKTIENMTIIYMILSTIIAGLVIVLALPLANFSLGKEYVEGYTLITPLTLGLVVWQATMLGHKGMELKENTKLLVVLILISAIVNLMLNLLLVPKFGYEVAAWTTFLSYIIYALLIWKYSYKYIAWKINFKKIVPFILFSTISIIITNFYSFSNIFLEIIRGTLSFIIIYILLFITWIKISKQKIIEFFKTLL